MYFVLSSAPQQVRRSRVGNLQHGNASAVASHVLSACSCRTTDAAATRHNLGALENSVP